MRVVVKPYSVFRDRLGDEVILEFNENKVVVRDILLKLGSLYGINGIGVKPIVIIGNEIVSEDYVVEGDHVVLYLVPPFSGG